MDDDEFQLVGTPYPWCETLSDNCDCQGAKGRLDEAFCSDFGLSDETEKRARKSENVRHQHYIRRMEEAIARRDESQREERLQREQRSPPRGAAPVAAKHTERDGDQRGATDLLNDAINRVNRLVTQGFYCSIHGHHHSYGDQAIRRTVASLTGACVQISTRGGANREFATSAISHITEHWLEMYQSEECAQRSVWGDVEIPDILYKYIPKDLIGQGTPESLRATQLLALNDDMECNVTTMKEESRKRLLFWLYPIENGGALGYCGNVGRTVNTVDALR